MPINASSLLVGTERQRARRTYVATLHAGFQSRVSNLPASQSRWTLVQYGTGRMSALPQKQTFLTDREMSAKGPKAEIAFYSITSSARVSSVGGTVRPSALAGLRLMTKSNLVCRQNARSSGLPLGESSRHRCPFADMHPRDLSALGHKRTCSHT